MTKVTMFARNDDRVEFWPINDVPGYTHRVIVNGKKVGYLHHEVKVSKKSAEFFFAKAECLQRAEKWVSV